jgi:hypothetical protein
MLKPPAVARPSVNHIASFAVPRDTAKRCGMIARMVPLV